jgi:hypothetical protein
MASVTDFLSGGSTIPSGSAVEDLTTTASLPDWYTNYGQQLIANQQALSAQPYNPAFGKQVAGFTPAQQAAFGQTAIGATSFVPGLEQAAQTTQGALQQSALGAAQPYLSTAAQTVPQNISQYMDPYTQQVVQNIGTTGIRTLTEGLLPQIQDQMVAAGQFGGSRQAEIMGRAIRDAITGISQQQAAALQSGYTQAQTAAQADLARQAQLAGTAGGLAAGDISSQLTGAQQQALQAKQLQDQTLTGATALGNIGTQQQGVAQSALDAAQANALAQQQYNQQQINAGLATLQGVKGATPTTTTAAGVVPMSQYNPTGVSDAAAVASGLSSLAGLAKTLGGS